MEAYDLVYLPQVFLPEDAFVRGLTTVWRALRPGGWLSLPAISAAGDDFEATLSRLRNALWGGGARLPQEVAEAVTRSGFTDVQVRSVGGPRHTVLARRPALVSNESALTVHRQASAWEVGAHSADSNPRSPQAVPWFNADCPIGMLT